MTNELYILCSQIDRLVFKLTTRQNCLVLYDLGLSKEFNLFKQNKFLVLLLLKPNIRTVLLNYASIESDCEAD